MATSISSRALSYEQLSGVATRWSSALTALAVPPRCVACGLGTSPDAQICDHCRAAIEHLPSGTLDPQAHAGIDAAFAAFPYEGPVREIVQALKYRGAVAAAREMAALIVERVPLGLLNDAVLIPVPAHPTRRRSRGFNQSALLAREVAAICELPVLDCLERDHSRAPQATLTRTERLKLPRQSIRVKPAAIGRKSHVLSADFPTKVVVLDDVVTTGVTLDVCASAIRERYPAGSSLRQPEDRMAIRQLSIGALTFASTSAHPARRQEFQVASNLK